MECKEGKHDSRGSRQFCLTTSLLKKAIVAVFNFGHATASCARGLPNKGFCESHV